MPHHLPNNQVVTCLLASNLPESLSALLKALAKQSSNSKKSDNNNLTAEEQCVAFTFDETNGNLLPATATAAVDKEKNDISKPNIDAYFSKLNSKNKLGRNVLYFPIVSSTMNVITALQTKLIGDDAKNNCGNGFVCWAAEQTAGRGRKGNEWTSPNGCAMFSILLPVPLASRLGKHLSFTQHLASIACVSALQQPSDITTKASSSSKSAQSTQQQQQLLPIKLKWPNDIYFSDPITSTDGSNPFRVKLGGIYVTSTIEHTKPSPTAWCNIGIGVNVSNNEPTMCVNQVMQYAAKNLGYAADPKCKQWTVPTYIAAVVNKFESLLEQCQAQGVESILPIYYHYWLHTGQRIIVKQLHLNPQQQESPTTANNIGDADNSGSSDKTVDKLAEEKLSLVEDGKFSASFPGYIDGVDEFGMLRIKYRAADADEMDAVKNRADRKARKNVLKVDGSKSSATSASNASSATPVVEKTTTTTADDDAGKMVEVIVQPDLATFDIFNNIIIVKNDKTANNSTTQS